MKDRITTESDKIEKYVNDSEVVQFMKKLIDLEGVSFFAKPGELIHFEITGDLIPEASEDYPRGWWGYNIVSVGIIQMEELIRSAIWRERHPEDRVRFGPARHVVLSQLYDEIDHDDTLPGGKLWSWERQARGHYRKDELILEIKEGQPQLSTSYIGPHVGNWHF